MAGYEDVSKIVGDEMDKAWKNILQQLVDAAAGSSPFTAASAGGGAVSASLIQDFVKTCGGANLSIEFGRKAAGAAQCVFRHALVVPTVAVSPASAAAMGEGRVDVSIGVNIKW